MRLLGDRLLEPPEDVEIERREEREPALETIVAAMGEDVERLALIASRFGKIGSPTVGEPVDIESVARRVVEYMRGRAPQREVRVDFREEYGGSPRVSGQEELLEWVVENLLKNAMDALSGKPGVITVRTATSADGRLALLQVEDTGAGIDPADQRRVFDPGFSRKRRGWGLGLALSRRLVESYGGRLRLVRSRPGEGSLFEAAIPATGGDDR
jgi:signal transduction histidine kinase